MNDKQEPMDLVKQARELLTNYDISGDHWESESERQLAQLADALESAIQPKWIPVSERLPEFPEGKHSVTVLVSGRWGVREAEWVDPIYNVRNKHPRWERDGRLLPFEPTHWIPMPEAPKMPA